MSTFEKIEGILRGKGFDVKGMITPATKLSALDQWDSFKQLSLFMAVEEAFGLEFGPEDAGQIQTIEDLISRVKN